MPEQIEMPFSRKTAAVESQTFGPSRSGSSASCTRLIPVACNLATRSLGFAGCSDQLHTASRSVSNLAFTFFQLEPHPDQPHSQVAPLEFLSSFALPTSCLTHRPSPL